MVHPLFFPSATFDSTAVALQRDRAGLGGEERQTDPLLNEVASRLVDRVLDCQRTFKRALVVGGCQDVVAKHLAPGTKGLESITHVDTSERLLERAKEAGAKYDNELEREVIVGEQERLLDAVEEQSFDLAIGCLGLHWANDLPGAMVQMRRALKPDGFFLAAIFGEETLPVRSIAWFLTGFLGYHFISVPHWPFCFQELRISCLLAEQEREGGMSPRTSPMALTR